jgi:hypothetical protein
MHVAQSNLDLGTCNVAAVVVDNASDPKFTILEIMVRGS